MHISEKQYDFDVGIVGGGISGIAAARTFSNSPRKLRWALFEANQKLGGRIQSIKLDGRTIDTGAYELASFYQHRPQKTEFYKMINQGYLQVENIQEKYKNIYYYDQTGLLFDQKTLRKINKKIDQMTDLAKKWLEKEQNLSLHQTCQRFMATKEFQQLSESQKRLFSLLIVMEEHQEAADGQNLPAQIMIQDEQLQEDCIDTYPIPTLTYDGVFKKIVNQLPKHSTIKLNSFVTKITRKNNYNILQVREKVGDKQVQKSYKCKYVICAAPLQAIKNKRIVFEPELPQSHSYILDNIGYGLMEKVILCFQQSFWPQDTQRIKIASNKRGKFPHFINLSGKNQNNEQSHILICFITAKFAEQIRKNCSDKQIAEEAVQQLRKAFPNKKIKLKDFHVTNWMEQKNINGAFSYVMPKLRFKRAKQIRKAINNLLWLAGQYCYPQNIGCAHGAYQTGYLAAKQIQSLQLTKD